MAPYVLRSLFWVDYHKGSFVDFVIEGVLYDVFHISTVPCSPFNGVYVAVKTRPFPVHNISTPYKEIVQTIDIVTTSSFSKT